MPADRFMPIHRSYIANLAKVAAVRRAGDDRIRLVLDDAQRTEEIALQRFKGGIASYLDVVTAQQSVLMNQQIAAQIAGQREVDSVVLIKALGGGWAGVKTP